MPEELTEILNLNQQNNPPSETEDLGLSNQYLQSVAEEDREIVGKYIKDWDANVTQKFQEYSEKLKPWESLGVEYDSARAAVQAMMFAEQDPVTFHQLLTEQLKELELLPGENPVGTETQGSPLPEFEGLNEGFVNRFTKLEENLNKVGEFMDNYNKENTRKSQEQMLDETLKALENEHGKFDEDAVLGRIIRKGMTPEEAVKDYQKYIKELNTPERRNPPPVLTNGRTGVEQVDASKIRNDKKARTSLIADLLNNTGD